MAVANSSVGAGAELARKPEAQGSAQAEALALAERELVPQAMKLSAPIARMPVELDVAVPVRAFRVRNLLALETGQVIETEWGHDEDLPLAAGEVQLAWSEFEVMDTTLAVRVTRLA
jgi:flagellar motor switch protein FliM